MKQQVSKNLVPRSEKCIFVGYPKETRRYYFYNCFKNKGFVARSVVFLGRKFISKGISGSKVLLEEMKEPQIAVEDSLEIHN